jgi:hypothetical protein
VTAEPLTPTDFFVPALQAIQVTSFRRGRRLRLATATFMLAACASTGSSVGPAAAPDSASLHAREVTARLASVGPLRGTRRDTGREVTLSEVARVHGRVLWQSSDSIGLSVVDAWDGAGTRLGLPLGLEVRLERSEVAEIREVPLVAARRELGVAILLAVVVGAFAIIAAMAPRT